MNTRKIFLVLGCTVCLMAPWSTRLFAADGATFEGHDTKVTALALSPDGSKLVSGDENGALKVWDIKSGKCLATIEAHDKAISQVAVSPNGKGFVSLGGDRGTVKVWSMASFANLNSFDPPDESGAGNACCFSPNSRYIYSGHTGEFVIWDLKDASFRKKSLSESDFDITSLDHKYVIDPKLFLLISDINFNLHMNDPVSLGPDISLTRDISLEPTIYVRNIALPPDGTVAAVSGYVSWHTNRLPLDRHAMDSLDREMRSRIFWSLNKPAFELDQKPNMKRLFFVKLKNMNKMFHLDLDAIFSGFLDQENMVTVTSREVQVWAIHLRGKSAGAEKKKLFRPGGDVESVAMSRDSKRLATCSKDSVKVLDLKAMMSKTVEGPLGDGEGGGSPEFTVVALTGDGKQVAIGLSDGHIKLKDVGEFDAGLGIGDEKSEDAAKPAPGQLKVKERIFDEPSETRQPKENRD
jgi:WD40 repeat protein